jgi:hypothetical protein
MSGRSCGCGAKIECQNETPGCTYPDPHFHGFACSKACAYCRGKRVDVFDPENHPRHTEWKRQRGGWPGKP